MEKKGVIDDNLAEFFKALSDETRLRILVLLSSKELCVCEVCNILDESQPKVSRHIAKLRDLGFVEDDRQGQWIFYYVSLKDRVATEILNTIVRNINNYPVLKMDMRRLTEKASDGQLCKREK